MPSSRLANVVLIDVPQTESSQLMTFTGPAYDGIVEKASKLKRTHWKQHMVPAMNPHGSLVWIKNEYKDLYRKIHTS